MYFLWFWRRKSGIRCQHGQVLVRTPLKAAEVWLLLVPSCGESREGSKPSPQAYKGTDPIIEGSTLLTPTNPIYSPKAPPPNTALHRVSTYDMSGDVNIHSGSLQLPTQPGPQAFRNQSEGEAPGWLSLGRPGCANEKGSERKQQDKTKFKMLLPHSSRLLASCCSGTTHLFMRGHRVNSIIIWNLIFSVT